MADVPMAFLLSGGLDSSLICSIIKRLKPNTPIHTFSIGIAGSPDLIFAKQVKLNFTTLKCISICKFISFQKSKIKFDNKNS